MRNAILAISALLAGCGGKTTASTSVTVTNTTVAVTSGGADCSTRPDFAPVYPGATIQICNAAHMDATGKDAGSIIYRTDAAPAAVLAWAREQTAKAGLTARISTPTMFSAGEGNKRTMMTHVEADGTGSRVVLNWGRAP